jgi:3-dehydroquinate synthase
MIMSDPIDIYTSRDHTYPIYLDLGGADEIAKDLASKFQSKKTFVIVDENVQAGHNGFLKAIFGSVFDHIDWYVVPSGESSKSMHLLSSILDFLLDSGLKRSNPVMVVGGGVTGDLGGFAASVALRGVPFAQFPTTLLSMVDSSVGGKTGINHRTGKNLIGSFYQPDAVYIDLRFLSTLPTREWSSGMGEVIKYAAISRPELFVDLKHLLDKGSIPTSPDWLPIIRACVEIKAEIVRADEMETGVRSYLNYGHTFAHAMEAASNYTGILHGEAVYLGMIAATHLSNMLGATLDVGTLLQFNRHLKISWPDTCRDTELLINLMANDKKNTEAGQTFVTLKEWGSPEKVIVHDRAMVHKAWLMAMHDIS